MFSPPTKILSTPLTSDRKDQLRSLSYLPHNRFICLHFSLVSAFFTIQISIIFYAKRMNGKVSFHINLPLKMLFSVICLFKLHVTFSNWQLFRSAKRFYNRITGFDIKVFAITLMLLVKLFYPLKMKLEGALLFVWPFLLANISHGKSRNRLLMISFDGSRWDYLGRGSFPNLQDFRKNGAAAEYVTSTFVTTTFPCHTTLVTGISPTRIDCSYS